MWQRVVKNTFWLTVGEVGGRFLRIILVLYSARVLGAADWGIFSYLLGLAALFTVVADIGLGAVLTRELVRNENQESRYLSTAFIIKIVLLALAGLLIVFGVPLITNISLSLTLLLATALLVISDNLRLFATSVYRAMEKMHLEALVNIVTQIALVSLGAWALYQTGRLENLAMAYVSGSIIGTLLSFWIVRRHLGEIVLIFDRELIKKMLSAAWPFALLGLLGGIMLNIDIIMLGWLRTPAEIGYYSSAQKIIFTLYVLPALIGAAVFPSLTRMANKDQAAFRDLLERALKLVFMVAFPIMIGGIVLSHDLIGIFYGRQYLPAITAFRILLVSLLINYPATIIGNALFAYDKQKEFIKFSIIGAGSDIVFNALLIPVWGIEGAAISTVFTQIISNAFIWRKMKQVNAFSIVGKLPKIAAVSLVMGLIVFGLALLNVNFFVSLGAAIIIYFGGLALVREPAVIELKNLIKERR